ncbi:MAG: CRISPR-associated helicase Cas3' [Syntrophothermus sp.]|uniref:CRISPR-associated helicase Cas3' n=1 Tax=Syntrophothermus sp. TaxID=2736299 RepID=UPI00257DDC31|nr:CRISPR-associated helicase Cas3' [Syntrophothermus sp.]NSW83322.1 CRISPR-associated helicase Cas3' [Syntrophothermus sp.]
MRVYYAHTRNSEGAMHRLDEHLLAVAELAGKYSERFYGGILKPLAWLAGVFHDIGKVSPGFQSYLEAIEAGRVKQKVPHSPLGALFSRSVLSRLEVKDDLALIVAGHHSGLDEIGTLTSKLAGYGPDQDLVQEMTEMLQVMMKRMESKGIKIPPLNELQRELLVRMLFSVLIDADRLDTELHFFPERARLRDQAPTLAELAIRFRKDQEELLRQNAGTPSAVNEVRKDVYRACVDAAKSPQGWYRLTAPTGAGKTRSALAFALEHALINGHERIIFALPYTSIIDQNAEVYRSILGPDSVLEHHSQVKTSDEEDEEQRVLRMRLAEENWDVPLIVTTTVQLLESLFSNRPSSCRKIHRIAKSVLIFDEAQTLPPELLRPTMQVLKDLAENYGTTVVLSTATQPALKDEFLPELEGIKIREIVPDYPRHFEMLKRVEYRRLEEPVSIAALAAEISRHQQVMVVMNTRRSALLLVDELGEEDCLHLSTLLCSAHRRKVLEEVRRRLGRGEPVRLVSTQVVEAGVDLDFPVVYRAVGPLDRIVQAAGRCNREGRLPGFGEVVIFELEDEKLPRGPYKAGLEQAKLILAECGSPDALNEPDIFEDYFSRLFSVLGQNLDQYGIQQSRSRLNFPKVAEDYRIIREDTVPVVVKYGRSQEAVRRWQADPSRDAWRGLQAYMVNIYEREAREYFRDGFLSKLADDLYLWEGVYDEVKGLSGVWRDPADLIV